MRSRHRNRGRVSRPCAVLRARAGSQRPASIQRRRGAPPPPHGFEEAMLDEAGGPTAGPYPLVRLYISGTYPLTVATLPADLLVSHYWPIIRARDPYGYCNVISAIDRVGTVYTSPTTSIPPTQCAWALEIDLPLTQPCVCAESPVPQAVLGPCATEIIRC